MAALEVSKRRFSLLDAILLLVAFSCPYGWTLASKPDAEVSPGLLSRSANWSLVLASLLSLRSGLLCPVFTLRLSKISRSAIKVSAYSVLKILSAGPLILDSTCLQIVLSVSSSLHSVFVSILRSLSLTLRDVVVCFLVVCISLDLFSC